MISICHAQLSLDTQTAGWAGGGERFHLPACEEALVPAHSQSTSFPGSHRAPMMQLTLKLSVKLCNMTNIETGMNSLRYKNSLRLKKKSIEFF